MRDIYPYVPRLFKYFNPKDEARFSVNKHIIKVGNGISAIKFGLIFKLRSLIIPGHLVS